MKLGLGICARNEEAGIIATITSVVHSARSAHSLEWELIVCANGCTDGTVALVNQWLLNNKAFAVTLEVLDVANLVDAQRLVVNRLGDRGASAIVLFDADILVDMECVPELLRTADNPSIKAAYARSVPTKSAQETIIEKVLNQYDSINTIFSERRHLHGRAFLIKEWSIPETEPPLLADDIYMSCDLLYRYGPDSIAESPKARVYFHQVSTVTDFYRAHRRRAIELSKCLQLFPNFRSLPPDQINRQMLWRKLLDEPLSRAWLWIILLSLRKYSEIRFRFELLLSRPPAEWEVTKTSKRPFHKE